MRSTCKRRKVGAVLVDKDDYIISTGFNGVPKGMVHCIDKACDGAFYGSGQRLDACNAIHAEINAIAHCTNPKEITTAYLTVFPCIHCIKALLATPCRRIVALNNYAHTESEYMWKKGGREYEIIND